jgi:hypothetical protein
MTYFPPQPVLGQLPDAYALGSNQFLILFRIVGVAGSGQATTVGVLVGMFLRSYRGSVDSPSNIEESLTPDSVKCGLRKYD